MLTSKSIRLQITVNSSHLTLTKQDTTLLINCPQQSDHPQPQHVSQNKNIKEEVEMEDEEEENLLDDDYQGQGEEQENGQRSQRKMWTIQQEDSYQYSSMHDHGLMDRSIIESLCTQQFLGAQIDELSTIKSNMQNGNESVDSNAENKDPKNENQNNEISTLNSANCENQNALIYLPEVREWNLNAKHQNSQALKQQKMSIVESIRSENLANFDFSANLSINCSNFEKISNLKNAIQKQVNQTQQIVLKNQSCFIKTHRKGVSLFSRFTDSQKDISLQEIQNNKKGKIKVRSTGITSLR